MSIEQAFERERPVLHSLFEQLGINIDNSKLVGLIQHALTLSPTTLRWLAIGLAVYAVIELIEGTGLWLAKRWGEYFAMVATSLGLPYEIYELIDEGHRTRLLLFAVNLLLVVYLVVTRRLFGVRGGKHAYEARLRSESLMEAAINAAAAAGQARRNRPARAARPQPIAIQPRPAQPPTPGPSTAAAAGPGQPTGPGTAPDSRARWHRRIPRPARQMPPERRPTAPAPRPTRRPPDPPGACHLIDRVHRRIFGAAASAYDHETTGAGDRASEAIW